jgi:hypothetical protein
MFFAILIGQCKKKCLNWNTEVAKESKEPQAQKSDGKKRPEKNLSSC